MEYTLRQAKLEEADQIWTILQDAIQKRKEEGSNQWQDGYPNPQAIANDIAKQQGFVLVDGADIVGYCAMAINDEPAYDAIEGAWLNPDDYVVFHRAAIAKQSLGKGLATVLFKAIENYALSKKVLNIKADTNFDNAPMLYLFDKLGYQYCGEVYFRGSARRAYQKVLG